MWHTNCGDRTFRDAEARLLAEALRDFVLELEVDEGDYNVSTDVFERLRYGQNLRRIS